MMYIQPMVVTTGEAKKNCTLMPVMQGSCSVCPQLYSVLSWGNCLLSANKLILAPSPPSARSCNVICCRKVPPRPGCASALGTGVI